MLYLPLRRIASSSVILAVQALLVGLPPALRAQESSLVKSENSYWTQTVTGSIDASEATKLKVSASGLILLSGREQPRLEYVLRKRIRAATRQEAEGLLSAAGVRLERTGTRSGRGAPATQERRRPAR